jgi:hypothetical protein
MVVIESLAGGFEIAVSIRDELPDEVCVESRRSLGGRHG